MPTTPGTTTYPQVSTSAPRTLFEGFQFSLNILGNAPLPGIKLAAMTVLDFFRRIQVSHKTSLAAGCLETGSAMM